MAEIKDVKLGDLQVNKIYSGENLIFEKIIDSTAPITTPRPLDLVNNPGNTYSSAQTVYLDVNEMCDTYYTTDGSTPTIASTKYVGGGIPVNATTTLKYFSVDLAGNTEAVKTTVYTINLAPKTFRYIRFQGRGDSANAATTRLVELQALEGATNRLLNRTPISGEAPSSGAAIGAATDGIINHTSGTYPLWWTTNLPTLIYDLGAAYAIDTLKVVCFSTVADPRQTKFIVGVSTDNVNWLTVADYSANTTVQPESGFAFAVAFA